MTPFRTILFAADFSESSKQAFHSAWSVAVKDKTRLFVLHVIEPNWGPTEPVRRSRQTSELNGAEPDEVGREALRQQMREVYTPGHPIDVEYCVREGDAAAEILRMAHEIDCDLIVMGTHGRTLLRRLLAGSVATAVLRGATCPVLALRSADRSHALTRLRVIVHPTDFSHGSDAALRVARSLARDRGARLVLLHVAPLHVVVEGGVTAALDVNDLRDALEAAREIVDGPDLKFPVETWFSQGAAADEIIHVAEEIRCDLIVMGTHGRTGLGRLLMGNTAESVLPETNCPVMIVKASEPVSSPTANSSAARQVVPAV
jgi:nucleotide-binding universal stress UspA family protein